MPKKATRSRRQPAAAWRPSAPRGLAGVMLVYGAILAAFLLLYAWLAGGTLLDPLLRLNAQGTGLLVRLLGFQATVDGARVLSEPFSLVIVPECTPLAAQAILAAGILATPAGPRSKALGIAAGYLALSVVNLVRTASLFYIGVRHPAALDIAHELVWQALMVLLALGLWALWVGRTSVRRAAS